MSRNFNIQSIIDGGDSAANPKLAEAMSQFRTPVFDTGDAKASTPASPAPSAATGAAAGAASSATTTKAPAPSASLQEHMKKFQTHLDFGDAKSSSTSPTPVVSASTAKPPARSSINSLINNEEPPADAASASASAPAKAPVKRQRKAPVKKRTAAAAADGAKATTGEKPAKKTKTKKATPEVNPAVAAPDPKVITSGSTTEKNKNTTETKTPASSILNLLNDEPQEEEVAKPTPPPAPAKDKEPVRDLIDDLYNRESRDKPKPLPIIALNIPLLDPNNPKPGQAEVVVNVLKLSEEKYGFDAIHPNAKSSTELMNDMLEEDDDDNADDDDIEIIVMPQSKQSSSSSAAKKGAEEEELTEEQLAHRHQVRMNKRVGKYDYEDPFIDDEELQIVEDISTTKEGFFVYWGPLVEETKPVKKTKKRTTEK
ncbi:hypothetical protein DIURU_000192 [Diutina rugosa]|uniref:Hpc2-related domain-containing protein n=1 Tax=Diutina rugosa TaxID=5481 RepID=A0A642V5Q1_DIURU|nr:uncharacterized protein DIURU_000192 [Diutina rugosa]KAA8908403.1 hypothetical protein DIURU_000192 [Diutina rugosa]